MRTLPARRLFANRRRQRGQTSRRVRDAGFRRPTRRTSGPVGSADLRGSGGRWHIAVRLGSAALPRLAGRRPERPPTAHRDAPSTPLPGTARNRPPPGSHRAQFAGRTTCVRWRNHPGRSSSGPGRRQTANPRGCVGPRPATNPGRARTSARRCCGHRGGDIRCGIRPRATPRPTRVGPTKGPRERRPPSARAARRETTACGSRGRP